LILINEPLARHAMIAASKQRKPGSPMDDPTLLLMLSAHFQRHPLLSSAKLGIAIEEGVAILSGYATDGSIKAVAELVALDLPGVRAVANEIETSQDETWRYVDCRIAKKACDLLEWNSLTPYGLRIRVEHGRLAIFGSVESQERLRAISAVLGEFSGAKSLDNNLKVECCRRAEPARVNSIIDLCA
jgi:osmotically-inducible protein OsmY